MRRRIAAAVLCVIVALSGLACSGAPAPASSPASPVSPVSPKAPRATAVPGFTVGGVRPVLANGSQDTSAQAGGARCDGGQLAADQSLGNEVASGFTTAGFPAAASLLRHFLTGRGTAVSYQAGSRISKLTLASSAFQVMNKQVQAAITERLKAGDVQVELAAGQLPAVTFSVTSSDLYWSFRGTQGLTVTGHGRQASGRYVGTLTYVIRDSYGFPADDTLDGFGPPMRYLQTACGAPSHAGGARWFPDTVAVTVPFDQPS